jgi:hypothetical protein
MRRGSLPRPDLSAFPDVTYAMLAIYVQARRWLLASTIACAGTLACRLLQSPESLPEPEFTCVQVSAPAPPPAVVTPASADHRVVVADLLSHGPVMPGCGTHLVDTTMVFTDVYNYRSRALMILRVLVPCAEMSRPMYSPTAGDAGILREGTRYRLELSGPVTEDLDGKNDPLWRADRIDLVRDAAPQRPAVADMMCRDVWGASCPHR